MTKKPSATSATHLAYAQSINASIPAPPNLPHTHPICTAPIGANAKIEGTKLIFNAGLFSLDGKQAKVIEEEIPIDDAKGFGIQAANKILNQGGASLMEKIKSQMNK